MTDNVERDKKVQGNGHDRVDMLCEIRRSISGLCSRGQTGRQVCTGQKHIDSIINSVVVLFPGHDGY